MLAENTHNLWAAKRIEEGWTWGPHIDEEKKTHPNLVRYADVPESEKEYDRMTAMEALKVIVAHHYRIVKQKD